MSKKKTVSKVEILVVVSGVVTHESQFGRVLRRGHDQWSQGKVLPARCSAGAGRLSRHNRNIISDAAH